MSSNGRIFSTIISIFFVPGFLAITSTRYMTSYCQNSVIFVNQSLILELTDQFLELDPNKDSIICAAKIVTDPGSRLMLHFVSLDISFHDLTPDRLHIFDYDQNGIGTRVSPIGGIYGIYDQYYTHKSTGVQDYISSSNIFRFDYMGKPTIIYRGFRVLITAIKDPIKNTGCPPSHFRCSKSPVCIPGNTVCNGDYNCGEKDTSDESQCNWSLTTGLDDKYAIGKIVTSGVVSCLSFVLVVLVVFGIVYKLNRRKYLIKRENIPVHVMRNSKGKWKITNDMGLTANIHSPPTYDDVIADDEQEEPPPAYESLPCSVRNSCEITPTRNESSVTIICVPNRDIHLYNEGSNSTDVRCYLADSDSSDNEVTEELSNLDQSSLDECSTSSANSSAALLPSEHEDCSESGSSNQASSNITDSPVSISKRIDSNDSLIRIPRKFIGTMDEEIEYIDGDDE